MKLELMGQLHKAGPRWLVLYVGINGTQKD